MSSFIKQEIIEQIDKMPIELQKRLLDFAHALVLSEPKGVRGKELLKFIGIMTSEEAEEIAKAIEEGCDKRMKASGKFLLDTSVIVAMFGGDDSIAKI